MLLPSHTSSHGRDNPALQVFQTGNDFAAFPLIGSLLGGVQEHAGGGNKLPLRGQLAGGNDGIHKFVGINSSRICDSKQIPSESPSNEPRAILFHCRDLEIVSASVGGKHASRFPNFALCVCGGGPKQGQANSNLFHVFSPAKSRPDCNRAVARESTNSGSSSLAGTSGGAIPSSLRPAAQNPVRERENSRVLLLETSLAFGRGLFLALLLATPAAALEKVSVFEDAPKGAAWFARIVIENEQGSATRTHTLATSKGDVSLSYFTTSNTPCQGRAPFNPLDCADDVVVRDLPDGVTASPLSVQVVEDGTAEILLYQFMGF